jgi:hypothetical protein
MVLEYQTGGEIDWESDQPFDRFLLRRQSVGVKQPVQGQQLIVFRDVIDAGVKVRVECDGKSYIGTTGDYFVTTKGVLALKVDLGTRDFLASDNPAFYLL